MRYKQSANLLQYLILAVVMVCPGVAIHAQTTEGSKTDQDIIGKVLAPIDRKMPKVFETASFGLG